jgi:glycosyltransferase involved in cell wall biosynthesis
LNGGFNVAVVNTFSQDEPLNEVLAAARHVPEVHLYITGKKKRVPPDVLASLPANVHFTDFLPDESYYGLLGSAHAVMCLTKRNHTMQRGACEALSLGRPVITSDWPLLRAYFHKGTVHVLNTPESIAQGLREMKERHEIYRAQIVELQAEQRREWEEKIAALADLIKRAFES